MDKKAKTDDVEYKAPKYFSFPTSIIPKLAKLDKDTFFDFMWHCFSYELNGYEEKCYPEDSRLAVYFEDMKAEIDKSVAMCYKQRLAAKATNEKKKNTKK